MRIVARDSRGRAIFTHLRGRVEEDGVRVEDLVEELEAEAAEHVDALSDLRAPRLHVEQEALERPVEVVYGEMEVELLDQQQLEVDDHVGVVVAFFHRIARDVLHKLRNGDVKLLDFACQIDADQTMWTK